MSTYTKKTHKIIMYEDGQGNWRWQMRSGRNKKIVADSAEGYDSEFNVMRAMAALPLDWPRISAFRLDMANVLHRITLEQLLSTNRL